MELSVFLLYFINRPWLCQKYWTSCVVQLQSNQKVYSRFSCHLSLVLVSCHYSLLQYTAKQLYFFITKHFNCVILGQIGGSKCRLCWLASFVLFWDSWISSYSRQCSATLFVSLRLDLYDVRAYKPFSSPGKLLYIHLWPIILSLI